MRDPVYALARVLLPILFVVDGIGQLANVDGLARMLQASMPPLPEQLDVLGVSRFVILGYLAGVVEIVAGVMVILGSCTRTAAVALAIFTACTIAFGHQFWTMEGQFRALNLTQALKNVSIVAGLLMIAALGAGPYSLDGRRRGGRAAV